jgi:hypothetical protein
MLLPHTTTNKLITTSLTGNEVGEQIGYWNIVASIHDEPVSILIVRDDKGVFTVARSEPLDIIGYGKSPGEAVKLFNDYVEQANSEAPARTEHSFSMNNRSMVTR